MKRLRLLAPVVGLCLALSLPVAVVSHTSDGTTPNCTNSSRIVVVVFDGGNLDGASDDWCAQGQQITGAVYGDPNFSQNNADPPTQQTDIGDHYLMNGFVSSLSVYNTTNKRFRVWLYPDPNYGGIPVCYDAFIGQHLHHTNIGFPYNNTYDSLIAREGPLDCNGDPFRPTVAGNSWSRVPIAGNSWSKATPRGNSWS